MILKSKNKNFINVKKLLSIKNIDINKIVVSNKVYFSKKEFEYLICYKVAKEIRPLCIFRKKMSAYRKNFDETKHEIFDKS